jgi:hypothetical protein
MPTATNPAPPMALKNPLDSLKCHGSEAEFRNQETRIAESVAYFHDAIQLLSTCTWGQRPW